MLADPGRGDGLGGIAGAVEGDAHDCPCPLEPLAARVYNADWPMGGCHRGQEAGRVNVTIYTTHT